MKHILTHQDAMAHFAQFAKSSINWCIEESDQSTTSVSKALDLLVAKTERVSKMSAASLAALNETKKSFETHMVHRKMSPEILGSLIQSLTTLSKEHEEIRSIIDPIIQNLQYQDRFRQCLENLCKMTEYWVSLRDDFISGNTDALTSIRPHEFGAKLLTLTTSIEERDVIRKHIPSLPPEARVEDSVTLF